jgi:hypothetical protein
LKFKETTHHVPSRKRDFQRPEVHLKATKVITIGDMPIFVSTQSTDAKKVGVNLAVQNKIDKNKKGK